jgi:hypothetical protein
MDVLGLFSLQALPVKSSEQGRLILAIDATYLLRLLNQMKLHGKVGIVGGPWHPDAIPNKPDPDPCFVPLDVKVNVGRIPKAGLMLEFLLWDPCAAEKVCMSACSMPTQLAASSSATAYKGNWDIRVLLHACS